MTEQERGVNNHAFLFIRKPFTFHNTAEHAVCLICRQGNGAQGLWKPFGTGDLLVWIQPGKVLAVLTANDWGMRWKLLGAPFQIFHAAGFFSDERFRRKSIWKTATWLLTRLRLFSELKIQKELSLKWHALVFIKSLLCAGLSCCYKETKDTKSSWWALAILETPNLYGSYGPCCWETILATLPFPPLGKRRHNEIY